MPGLVPCIHANAPRVVFTWTAEHAVLRLRDPMAFNLARLVESLPVPYRIRIYRTVESMVEDSR
jgi:hypothetical protein